MKPEGGFSKNANQSQVSDVSAGSVRSEVVYQPGEYNHDRVAKKFNVDTGAAIPDAFNQNTDAEMEKRGVNNAREKKALWEKEPWYPELYIVLDAIIIVELFLAFNGWYIAYGGDPKDPIKGDQVKDSVAKFDAALRSLDSAAPDASQWSGSAADAFIAQLAVIHDQVDVLRLSDITIKNNLDEQAKDVRTMRGILFVALAGLSAVKGGIVEIWYTQGAVAAQQTVPMQVMIAAATFKYLGLFVPTFVLKSKRSAGEVDRTRDAYRDAGRRAEFGGGSGVGSVSVGVAQESVISGFGGLGKAAAGAVGVSVSGQGVGVERVSGFDVDGGVVGVGGVQGYASVGHGGSSVSVSRSSGGAVLSGQRGGGGSVGQRDVRDQQGALGVDGDRVPLESGDRSDGGSASDSLGTPRAQ